MTDSDVILAELKSVRSELRAIREQTATPVAVKRREAARLMGIGSRKLEQLIVSGKVRTAEDAHLVPMSEVKRFCAPKVKRERKPSIGIRASRRQTVDAQSDDAVAALRERLRRKASR